jgi:hypothetical protein
LERILTLSGEIKKPDMATSIKPVLRLDKMKADGKAPLFIRITTNRRTSYRSIGISLDPKHWDSASGRIKNGHPNSARANHKLAQCLAELNNAVYEHEIAKTPFGPTPDLDAFPETFWFLREPVGRTEGALSPTPRTDVH